MPWHLASFVIPFVAGIVTIYIYRDKLPRGMKYDYSGEYNGRC